MRARNRNGRDNMINVEVTVDNQLPDLLRTWDNVKDQIFSRTMFSLLGVVKRRFARDVQARLRHLITGAPPAGDVQINFFEEMRRRGGLAPWRPLSDATIRRKRVRGSRHILVDTGQLLNSINAFWNNRNDAGAVFLRPQRDDNKTNPEIATYHELGTRFMHQRQIFGDIALAYTNDIRQLINAGMTQWIRHFAVDT